MPHGRHHQSRRLRASPFNLRASGVSARHLLHFELSAVSILEGGSNLCLRKT